MLRFLFDNAPNNHPSDAPWFVLSENAVSVLYTDIPYEKDFRSERNVNPFVLLNLEPKCAPGDPILYPESLFCYSP